MKCATDGASIYYTLDGSVPTDASTLYEKPILLDTLGDITIKAIAIKGTGDDAILSSVATFTYTVIKETILAPTADPADGAKVEKTQKITLKPKTEGATIYYTTDGTTPTKDSTEYTEPFSVGSEEGLKTFTVKAIAIKGENSSDVATFTYTITGAKLATPTATPDAGSVVKGTKVSLACADSGLGGVTLYYTVDGSEPDSTDSTKTEYTAPISITKDTTIKVIAVSENNADSDIATFEYTIKKPTLKPATDSVSSSIVSGVDLKGDITFTNGTEEIFNIEVKAEKVTTPSDDVKAAAENLKENGGEIIYYDITLVNKDNPSDTVKVVKGETGADGIAPAISITMPYTIATSSDVGSLNNIIVLHGTEQIEVKNGNTGFTFTADSFSPYTVIVNPKADGAELVNIYEYAGYEEGAYAEWKPVEGADGYMAYVAPANGKWTRIDNELIRQYADYWRVDTVGLAKGNYFIKIDAVTLSDDKNTATVIASNTTEVLKVTNYDRSGFAFSEASTHKTGSGAYNDDGTLKDGAKVLYVTNENFMNVSVTVKDKNNKDVTFTGVPAIVDSSGVAKTSPNTPIDIRIIGTIDTDGFPKSSWTSSSEGLQIKGSNAYTNKLLTIEGIGEDATINGFGFLIRNGGNVELRNFAVMNFNDDGISLDTANCNIWVHDLDIYYGNPGEDADQAKGDGSIDIKGDSKYCTFSYNHFWDSGKCSLCGMKSETGPNYITYHHNWFDHSDSRHPRIRTMSVHVYNNYFDGNSKYGVGVTTGGSAFVEGNYFRNCANPMLISKQGTDAKGAGTFSGENGGIIKAYNNHIEGAQAFVPYSSNPTDFDAYVVENASDTVPESVKAKAGGTSYNNFDTASTMYSYEADMPEEAREKVVSNAGRLNGGDLQFIFDNTKEDKNYGVITELKDKVVKYTSSVVAIGGKVKGDPEVVEMPGGGSTNAPTYTPKNVTEPEANPTSRQVPKNTEIKLSCATPGASIYYTLDGSIPTASSLPYTEAIVITGPTTVRAIAIYGGEQSDVKSFYYTVIGEGTEVNPGSGVGGDKEFETKIYMFNPEADEMAADVLSADVTSYGTDGYFTIDNTEQKAKISLISTSTPPKPKAAPADTHGGQEEYLLRFSFGAKTTKDSKQAIRFTNEYAARVYIGAYVSNDDAKAGKTKIYLDTDENATDPCVNASTEYAFEVEAGEHVIYAKDDGTAYILYVVVEEQVPVATNPPAGTVAAPEANQPSGDVPKGTKVELSAATGAKIYYTLNGDDPTTTVSDTNKEYTGTAIDLGNDLKKVTLKAIAVLDGKTSDVATYEYQITDQYVITIDRLDGTTPKETVIVAGTALTETDLPSTLTREGYTFQGWVDEENNAITVPYTPSKSMTIKAKWQSSTTNQEIGLHVKLAAPNATYVYTGSAIKPAIIVTNNGDQLIEGVDYTVKYSNNVKACEWDANGSAPKNAPKITVTGKGNLTSSTFTNFSIAKKNIGETDTAGGTASVKAGAVTVAKNSKATPILVYNGMKLGAKDYTYKDPAQKNQKFGDASKEEAETFEIELEGNGNYTGSRKVTVKAVKKDDLKTFTVTVSKVDLIYNGKSQLLPEDAITVQDKKTKETLKNDNDHTYYEVVYGGDTTNAGTVKFSVIGMGDYTGTVSKSYTIKPLKDNTKFYVDQASIKTSYDYNSAGVTLGNDLKVYYGKDVSGTKLQEGSDYKVTYSSNKKVGKGKYTITFLGNFKGSKTTGEFTIDAASLKKSGAKVESADKVFKKAGIYKSAPIVTINGVALKASDYKVEYYIVNADNSETLMGGKNKVTAADTTIKVKVTGKGSYKTGDEDSVTGTYMVCDKGTKTDLSSAKVTFYEKNADGTKGAKVTKLDYTGRTVEPYVEVTVKGKSDPLTPNVDYTVRFVNNKNKGKATAIITAKGDSGYVGCKTAKFSIVAKNLKQTNLLSNLFKIFGM
ncbi:MAG: chitobiase/beta-hexosaminidase C-terminal domain-containing protein [Butyrivibrio sp.]|nr:chitobiase/beta-hexosaminidase C-terminal domain-containing protein [Butyrivibrio sp.]